jgi:hypothetical protein
VLRNTEVSVDAIEATTVSPFPELTRRGSNVLNEARPGSSNPLRVVVEIRGGG